jgi:hypothetical protein
MRSAWMLRAQFRHHPQRFSAINDRLDATDESMRPAVPR